MLLNWHKNRLVIKRFKLWLGVEFLIVAILTIHRLETQNMEVPTKVRTLPRHLGYS